MLTGMLAPTKGAAEIFNQNLFSGGLDYVRKYMGVCPQHDILFDLLTPYEHLSVFIDFKGADEIVQPGPWWKKIFSISDSPHKQDEI
jgi:ABC-type multidrug transport system ATPase subunit